MASPVSRGQSTPRKVKALLSSFIHGPVSDFEKCCEDETVRPVDSIDGLRNKDPAEDHKRVFQPENKLAFYDRVHTYTPFKWFDPLTNLTPLECSRYGWENIDTNTLKCVSCKEVLYAGSPESSSFEQDCELSKNMLQLIKSAHSNICPWPTSPSPEKFAIVVDTTPKLTASEFYKRMENIIKEKDSLPKLDLEFVASQGIDLADVTHTVEKVCNKFQKVEKIEEEVCVAGLLAMFGWTNSELEGSSIIACSHCNRQAGLWNFTSLKEKENTNAETLVTCAGDAEPEAKKRKLMELQIKTFNPSSEHRCWCPWIASIDSSTKITDTQTSPDIKKKENITNSDDQMIKQMLEPVDHSTVGWKQVLEMLKRSLEEPNEITRPTLANTTPPSQAWKTVKRILGFFQGKSQVKHDP